MVEHRHRQRQRVMMIFSKPDSDETGDKMNNSMLRAIPMEGNERKVDDTSSYQDNSSSTISKLVTMQPDNAPMNLFPRYEATALSQSTSLNRLQTVVRLYFFEKLIFI
jgi:hypothetical protein